MVHTGCDDSLACDALRRDGGSVGWLFVRKRGSRVRGNFAHRPALGSVHYARNTDLPCARLDDRSFKASMNLYTPTRAERIPAPAMVAGVFFYSSLRQRNSNGLRHDALPFQGILSVRASV